MTEAVNILTDQIVEEHQYDNGKARNLAMEIVAQAAAELDEEDQVKQQGGTS